MPTDSPAIHAAFVFMTVLHEKPRIRYSTPAGGDPPRAASRAIERASDRRHLGPRRGLDRGEGAGHAGRRKAAADQASTKPEPGPMEPAPERPQRQAKPPRRGGAVDPLDVAEDHDRPISGREAGDLGVDGLAKLGPFGWPGLGAGRGRVEPVESARRAGSAGP